MKLVILLLVLCPISVSSHVKPYPLTQCNCPDKSHCEPIDSWNTTDRQVMVTTNGLSDYKGWLWDAITTVMILDDHYNRELACYTHSMGKQFGVFIPVPVELMTDPDDKHIHMFINITIKDFNMRHIDIVAFDILKLLGNCEYSSSHVEQIYKVVETFVMALRRPKLKVLFVMPWKPPCYDNNCGLAARLAKLCDGIITSPESFRTFCDPSCHAEATAPYAKQLMGIQEYISAGFNQSQLLIGIPWHGYNYTCKSYVEVTGKNNPAICNLKTKNETTCDVEGNRNKAALGTYFLNHPQWVYKEETYSKFSQAPYHEAKDSNNAFRQTWYEDTGSLTTKYQIVSDYKLKGCVIYTAEDLTNGTVASKPHFSASMWAWLLHATLSTDQVKVESTSMHVAATVAGVGCGMFVFGCLLGTVLTCIVFNRKVKLHQPFRRDALEEDDFHDDEQNL